ncbi:HNH endonuclease [Jatrophihabitans telluris]|uniref:HNH endonuclease n=1 Tax=Jatrophihabitans telluris TaxID=2038343 RepID=A0ABY4QU20_9ACTN|nr:HNH endonuclease signature motif containing protein [Jatrophihabitans telluris]UQX87154.1 HNH endonuclease [Jatrophihabitans telluris]
MKAILDLSVDNLLRLSVGVFSVLAMTAIDNRSDERVHEATCPSAATLFVAIAEYLQWVDEGAASRLPVMELAAELRAVEGLRRRLDAVEAALVAVVDSRGMAAEVGARSTADLLVATLRFSPAQARRRVAIARALCPRLGLSGAALPPVVPVLARAYRNGAVSTEQVTVVLEVLDKIPAEVGTDGFDRAAEVLTELAHQAGPRELSLAGQRLLDTIDPDGRAPRDELLNRRRSLSLLPASDGSWQLRGQLSPVCGQLLWSFLDARSAPRPAGEQGADPRSHPQRMHDALEEAAGVLARHQGPTASGAPATVIITMTAEQFAQRGRHGSVVDTASGQPLGAHAALGLAEEAEIAILMRDSRGAVLDLARTRRIASRDQTLALIARDRGCSFPDCDAPPTWTQRHHVRAWQDGGRTDINNLTLLCHFHHREFGVRGWTCRMHDGLPAWIPPVFIDPDQRPRYNRRIRPPIRE